MTKYFILLYGLRFIVRIILKRHGITDYVGWSSLV